MYTLEDIELPETIEMTFLELLPGKLADYLPTLGSALLLLIAGLAVRKIVLSLLRRTLSRSKLDKTVHGFVTNAADAVITALVVIIVLSTLGIPMTSIIAVFSAAGLAVGLALQNSLANVAGGFIILISKPFKAGDYISAAGSEGTVDEITMLTTKIVTVDNKAVYIPNGTLAGATVTNFTREKLRRVDITFGISYESDSEKALKLIKEVISGHDKALSEPVPVVRIISLGESSVDIVSRVWVNSEDYWDVYFDLIEQVRAAFDQNDIVIPYKQLVIRRETDSLKQEN